jgi:nucleosome binding factor SPN SPT16 subunit
LQFHEKLKGSDGRDLIADVLARARDAGAPLGVLSREKPDGGLSTLWHESAAGAGLEQVDVAPALARLMAPKDSTEITNIKRAAHLSSAVLEKFVVAKIEAVVDDAGKVSTRRALAITRHAASLTRCPHTLD